jgi:uncharacterized membrane protein
LEFPPVLIVTIATLAVAYLTKHACFGFGLGDSRYCFSDYGPVYYARHLAGGRFPYWPPALEYPAGLGLVLWLAAAITTSGIGFVRVNMLFASIACVATVWILWRHVGRRALLFAGAPTVALYAFLNWDLIAVVCGVAAIAAFVRRRDVASGALLGLGTAIKVFPVLLLVPLVVERLRERDRSAIARILVAAAFSIAALNVPVAWVSFDGWAYFLRFNSTRVVDWGTLWSAGCQTFGVGICADVALVNVLAPVAFLVSATAAWILITRAAPHIPRWQLGFPLMVTFFLTNKVYSPQYSLWILPWFALVLPDIRLFLAYEVIDLGIYVTSFAWQQHLTGSGGLPIWPLNVFIALRAVLLVTMLVAFGRRAASDVTPDRTFPWQ